VHAKRNLPQAKGSLRLDKVSPLMGDGIHDADLMMWFLGRAPTRIYGRNIRFNEFRYPDVGWAMLEFGEEAIGVVETNWGLPVNVPTVIDASLQVIGTDGMLTIDCSHTGLTILDASGLKMQDTDYWPEQHGSLVGVLQSEIAYFADCIRNNRDPDVITPEEAFRAVSVMEAAERSAAAAQPVVIQ
jgi:UDP-N-acetylglucosamine 3-dehydrogenase